MSGFRIPTGEHLLPKSNGEDHTPTSTPVVIQEPARDGITIPKSWLPWLTVLLLGGGGTGVAGALGFLPQMSHPQGSPADDTESAVKAALVEQRVGNLESVARDQGAKIDRLERNVILFLDAQARGRRVQLRDIERP